MFKYKFVLVNLKVKSNHSSLVCNSCGIEHLDQTSIAIGSQKVITASNMLLVDVGLRNRVFSTNLLELGMESISTLYDIQLNNLKLDSKVLETLLRLSSKRTVRLTENHNLVVVDHGLNGACGFH